MRKELEDALHELSDYADDVGRASFRFFDAALQRYVDRLHDGEPIQVELDRALPDVDFKAWYEEGVKTVGSMVGSGRLDWPADLEQRVALQRRLLQAFASGEIRVQDFCSKFAYSGRKFDDNIREVVNNIFRPFHRDVLRVIRRHSEGDRALGAAGPLSAGEVSVRVEQHESEAERTVDDPRDLAAGLERFREDHGERRCAFLMMQFRDGRFNRKIESVIRECLKEHGILGLRADDKEYLDDLLGNVRVYMHGCEFGICVFERIETEDVNPNVSLEVGYMMALAKPVCLLKERTVQTLQTDLAGRLYKEFSLEDVKGTLAPPLFKWMRDRDLV